MRVVTMWRRPSPAAQNAPSRAVLFDSVPPLVKTTSAGAQPRRSASCARARATACAAGTPAQCPLEGLPYEAARNGAMAACTSGWMGVLAL